MRVKSKVKSERNCKKFYSNYWGRIRGNRYLSFFMPVGRMFLSRLSVCLSVRLFACCKHSNNSRVIIFGSKLISSNDAFSNATQGNYIMTLTLNFKLKIAFCHFVIRRGILLSQTHFAFLVKRRFFKKEIF